MVSSKASEAVVYDEEDPDVLRVVGTGSEAHARAPVTVYALALALALDLRRILRAIDLALSDHDHPNARLCLTLSRSHISMPAFQQ